MRTALVDLDSIVIAAGALSEDVYYVVGGLRFNYKREATEYCDQHNIPKQDIEREVDVKPVSHAINILSTTLNAAVREAGCISYEAYLSPDDKSNFRFTIYPEYKGNRKNVVKPTHTKALRAYAVKHLAAQVVSGMEADDILSIRAHELGFDNSVVITIDKDLKQIPAWFYNWQKKGDPVKIEVEDARRNFYTQVLVGDSIDNIKGCPGIGPAKAGAALKDCQSEEDYIHAVFNLFVAAYDGDEQEAKADFKLNATLCRLLTART